MRAVSGDEVDDRRFVLDRAGELHPAFIGFQLRIAVCLLEEVAPRGVQRRYARIAPARQVDGGEVQRQTQEVVAQRAGDELVDVISDLARHAADNRAGHLIGRQCVELDRIEEAFNQADVLGVEARIEAVDAFGQHRVAEPVHDVRELGDDGGIDGDIEAVRHQKDVDVRLDLARELFEHEVLVLHLGAELGGLEDAFAVPVERRDLRWRGRHSADGHVQPFVEERDGFSLRRALRQHRRGIRQRDFLGMLHQAVVLGVEDVVHGG